MPSYDFGGAMLRGAQMAYTLENLNKLSLDREKEAKVQEAVKRSTISEPITGKTDEGLNINLGAEQTLDPNIYAQELAKVDPEKAATYQNVLTQHEAFKQNLEKGEIELKSARRKDELEEGEVSLKKSLLNHQTMADGFTYLQATKDISGTISFINNNIQNENDKIAEIKPLPNGNFQVREVDGDAMEWDKEKMQFLGRSRDVQLQQWVELTTRRENIEAGKDKSKPKVAKKAGPTDLNQAKAFIRANLKNMDSEQEATLSSDLANLINDIEVEYINRKEQPPDYEQRREEALGRLQGKITHGTGFFGSSFPMYFNKPEGLIEAARKGQVTKEQAETILKNEFPEWYEKELKKRKKK